MSTTRKPIKKSTLMLMISIMTVTLVFLVAILIVTVSYFLNKKSEPTGLVLSTGESVYSEEELNQMLRECEEKAAEEVRTFIRTAMEDGRSTVSVLRELFPELTVYTAGGRYHFHETKQNLALNPYINEKFQVDENGFVEYNDSVLTSKKGIDVSSYQGKIDWKKVKNDGVEYALIRVGYRGYGEAGKLVTDERFEENMKGATSNGVDVGVYFFSQATSEKEAVEEANYVLDEIEGYDLSYPVIIDIENLNRSDARTAGLTKEQWTKNAIAFCETVKAAGYTPMIYGNLESFLNMLDVEQIEVYDKWFAQYDTSVYFPYDFEIWQYSESGYVDGISEKVDLNVGFYEPAN